MLIKNSKNWVTVPVYECIYKSLSILFLCFLVRYWIHPYIEPYAAFHFFIVGCILIAYLYGYTYACFGILISIFVGGYFFVKPYEVFGTFDENNSTDWIQFANFAIVTFAAVLVIEKLQKSLYEKELMLKVMLSRHRIELLDKNN